MESSWYRGSFSLFCVKEEKRISILGWVSTYLDKFIKISLTEEDRTLNSWDQLIRAIFLSTHHIQYSHPIRITQWSTTLISQLLNFCNGKKKNDFLCQNQFLDKTFGLIQSLQITQYIFWIPWTIYVSYSQAPGCKNTWIMANISAAETESSWTSFLESLNNFEFCWYFRISEIFNLLSFPFRQQIYGSEYTVEYAWNWIGWR